MRNPKEINIFTLVSLLLIFSEITFGQKLSCKLFFDESTPMINGRTNASSIQPGDTICLTGNWQFLQISYLHGSRKAPIVIINKDSQVHISGFYYGINFDSCSYIKLTGNGLSSIKYGFKIYNINGFGLSIGGLSSDIEVENIEISNTVFIGISAKTDPDTSFTSTRDKYTMRNVAIHDCYFHNIGSEGFYVGSSSYDGVILKYHGKDTLVYPHLIRGVKIYNNRLESTGWDGIQVASADSGCAIYNNFILHDSDSTYWNQMTGILLGGGSNCDCFNNIILDGKGDGIDVFSLGRQKIYNNLIINPGRTYHPDEDFYPYQKHGIYIGNNLTTPNEGYTICYNTIISPKSTGIKFTNLNSKKNLIINNIIINPGSYKTLGQEAFINISEPSIDVTVLNNYLNTDFSQIKFIDPSSYNFDLEPTSPAVNKAISIDGFPLQFDIQNRNRPFAWQNDIGAFECHDSSLIGIPELIPEGNILCKVFPNPSSEDVNIEYSIKNKTNLKISMYDMTGKMIMEPVNSFHLPGFYSKKLSVVILKPGIYSILFQTDQTTITREVLLIPK